MGRDRTSATGGAPHRGRRAPRWLWAALVVSVTLNLVGIGMIAGGTWREMDEEDRVLGRWQSRMVTLFPEGRQAEVRAHFLANRAEMTAAREAVWASTRRTAEVLRAPEFSRAELEATLAERKAAFAERFDLVYGQLADMVERLEHAERMEIADRIEARLEERAARRAEREAAAAVEAAGAPGAAGGD